MGPVALKNLKVNEAVGNGDIDGAYEVVEKNQYREDEILKKGRLRKKSTLIAIHLRLLVFLKGALTNMTLF